MKNEKRPEQKEREKPHDKKSTQKKRARDMAGRGQVK